MRSVEAQRQERQLIEHALGNIQAAGKVRGSSLCATDNSKVDVEQCGRSSAFRELGVSSRRPASSVVDLNYLTHTVASVVSQHLNYWEDHLVPLRPLSSPKNECHSTSPPSTIIGVA